MRYVSTRGAAPVIGFREAVLTGLAVDGGLYVPETWPSISLAEQRTFKAMPFSEVAARILARFAGGEADVEQIAILAAKAFSEFDHPDIAPLVPLGGDDWLLELFHGPTLAFKDVAMSMLAQLYGWALSDSGRGKTIIGATSGDTGGAAVHAFASAPKAEVFMLHPKGRISEVQRRIMTTLEAGNVFNIAVEGTFDDCQRIVKTLFADEILNRSLDLGGVNSINWVRLAVQTVYYFTAAARFDEDVSFVAPTGNFGDIFAGYAAKRMGLPVRRLGIAVNRNDIMRRVIETGVYEPTPVSQTTSPSMDIQIASNFERLIFEAFGRDPAALAALMRGFERDGKMTLPRQVREFISEDFCAARADEDEVADKIREMRVRTGMIVDPHTAVGMAALGKMRESGAIKGPAVSLATAHPAKFPDAVEAAAGVRPGLPARYEALISREERLIDAPADVAAIRRIMLERSLFT